MIAGIVSSQDGVAAARVKRTLLLCLPAKAACVAKRRAVGPVDLE